MCSVLDGLAQEDKARYRLACGAPTSAPAMPARQESGVQGVTPCVRAHPSLHQLGRHVGYVCEVAGYVGLPRTNFAGCLGTYQASLVGCLGARSLVGYWAPAWASSADVVWAPPSRGVNFESRRKMSSVEKLNLI